MNRKLCVIHANCQGEELETLLRASTAFSRTFRVERYTNYAREPVPEASLAGCEVFLYQHLGPGWGNLASDALLRQLPPGACALCLPNLFFNGSWPMWTRNSPMAFGDVLLDRLLDLGESKPVILRIYLRGDIKALVNLEEILERCVAMERAKEAHAFMKTVDWILERWKKRPLFHTVNHPGRELMCFVADGVLDALGLPPLTEPELAALPAPFPSYADFDQPVHPQVATLHGLEYILPGQTFAVFGRQMTSEQYVSRYIDCRLNGFSDDFVSYLHMV